VLARPGQPLYPNTHRKEPLYQRNSQRSRTDDAASALRTEARGVQAGGSRSSTRRSLPSCPLDLLERLFQRPPQNDSGMQPWRWHRRLEHPLAASSHGRPLLGRQPSQPPICNRAVSRIAPYNTGCRGLNDQVLPVSDTERRSRSMKKLAASAAEENLRLRCYSRRSNRGRGTVQRRRSSEQMEQTHLEAWRRNTRSERKHSGCPMGEFSRSARRTSWTRTLTNSRSPHFAPLRSG
jgi:hypothetical protein